MPLRGNMKRLAREAFNEDLDTLIPRLMRQHRTPYLVAIEIGVYANSVRSWLIEHNWRFDNGAWVEPQPEMDAVHG